MEAELKQTEAYHEKTGGNLLKDLMNAEIEAGERIVMRNHSSGRLCTGRGTLAARGACGPGA